MLKNSKVLVSGRIKTGYSPDPEYSATEDYRRYPSESKIGRERFLLQEELINSRIEETNNNAREAQDKANQLSRRVSSAFTKTFNGLKGKIALPFARKDDNPSFTGYFGHSPPEGTEGGYNSRKYKKATTLAKKPKKPTTLAKKPKKPTTLAKKPKKPTTLAKKPKKPTTLAKKPKKVKT